MSYVPKTNFDDSKTIEQYVVICVEGQLRHGAPVPSTGNTSKEIGVVVVFPDRVPPPSFYSTQTDQGVSESLTLGPSVPDTQVSGGVLKTFRGQEEARREAGRRRLRSQVGLC